MKIAGSDVHVWRAEFDVSDRAIERFWITLSSGEQQRASAYYQERHRREFICAHGLLREILSRYTGIPAGRLEFVYGSHGKPSLAGGEPGTLRFNASHSGGLGLYAVGLEREIGVDVERVRSVAEAEEIATRWFSPAERRWIREAPEPDRGRAFFSIWTRKEAYVKARGEGLTIPLEGFSVPLERCGQVREHTPTGRAPVWVHDVGGEGYAAAVAVEAAPASLSYWEWELGS